jgi:hypothetical protein
MKKVFYVLALVILVGGFIFGLIGSLFFKEIDIPKTKVETEVKKIPYTPIPCPANEVCKG